MISVLLIFLTSSKADVASQRPREERRNRSIFGENLKESGKKVTRKLEERISFLRSGRELSITIASSTWKISNLSNVLDDLTNEISSRTLLALCGFFLMQIGTNANRG